MSLDKTINKITNNKIVNKLKISPHGFIRTGLFGGYLLLDSMYDFNSKEIVPNGLKVGLNLFSSFQTIYGLGQINYAFSIYKKQKKILKKKGFIESLIKSNLVDYCNRQATKIACYELGFKSEFDKLNEKTIGKKDLIYYLKNPFDAV